MQSKKLAFIGSVGAGKTTLIENLSEMTALNTDVESTVDIGKVYTTVGIDFGIIDVDKDLKLGLYGVPGQKKFTFLWDFVKEGLWAVVILVKSNCKESIKELDYLLDYFEIDEKIPCLIGITHSDTQNGDYSKNKIKSILQERGLILPIYSINAKLKDNAELIIRTLILLEETNNGT